MHDHTQSWLRLLPIGLFLLLLTGAAGASLTVIHLRQEEGRLAESTAHIRADFTESGRRVEEMTATVASAEQPEALRARVGTRLAPMTEKQIVWVRPGGSVPIEVARPAAAPALSFKVAFDEPANAPGMPR